MSNPEIPPSQNLSASSGATPIAPNSSVDSAPRLPPSDDSPLRTRRLIEAVVVAVCLLTTAGIALPQLLPTLRVVESRATADDAAAFVTAARRLAMTSGGCVEVVATTSPQGHATLQAARVGAEKAANCPRLLSKPAVETFVAPAAVTQIAGDSVVFTSTGAPIASGHLILNDRRVAPRQREIRVNPRGQVCVREALGGAEATFSPDDACAVDVRPPRGLVGCSQLSPAETPWLAALFAAAGLGRRRRRRRRPLRRRGHRVRGYMLIEVSIAALVLLAVVGLAFAYTGRVRAAQERQELRRVATEFAHLEAERLQARPDLSTLIASEDAVVEDRRMVRSVQFRRIRADGAPSDEGALVEVQVRVKYPSPDGPQSVIARRLLRVR